MGRRSIRLNARDQTGLIDFKCVAKTETICTSPVNFNVNLPLRQTIKTLFHSKIVYTHTRSPNVTCV